MNPHGPPWARTQLYITHSQIWRLYFVTKDVHFEPFSPIIFGAPRAATLVFGSWDTREGSLPSYHHAVQNLPSAILGETTQENKKETEHARTLPPYCGAQCNTETVL